VPGGYHKKWWGGSRRGAVVVKRRRVRCRAWPIRIAQIARPATTAPRRCCGVAIGFVGGALLGSLVVYVLISKWGANQWGPFAAWFSGVALFAIVWQASIARRAAGIAQDQGKAAQDQAKAAQDQAGIAQDESTRLHIARLVDHEGSRRRECIKALVDLWAAFSSTSVQFSSFTQTIYNARLQGIAPCSVHCTGSRHFTAAPNHSLALAISPQYLTRPQIFLGGDN